MVIAHFSAYVRGFKQCLTSSGHQCFDYEPLVEFDAANWSADVFGAVAIPRCERSTDEVLDALPFETAAPLDWLTTPARSCWLSKTTLYTPFQFVLTPAAPVSDDSAQQRVPHDLA